jgi:hypothetical protein
VIRAIWRFPWWHVLVNGTQAFAINLMLVLGLHVLPPIAFFCPLGTGFVMGWRMMATHVEGLMLGVVMGLWMWALCGAVGLAILFIGSTRSITFGPNDVLAIVLLSTFLVAHLAIFAGAGAMLGGHYARRELETFRSLQAR